MWFEWSQEKLKAIPGKDNKPFLIYFPKVFWKEKILNFADTSTKLTSKLLLARRRPTLLSKAIKFEEIVVQIGDLQIVKSENFLMFVSWKLKRLSFTGGWTTTSSLLGLLAIVDAALNKEPGPEALNLELWSDAQRASLNGILMSSEDFLKQDLNKFWHISIRDPGIWVRHLRASEGLRVGSVPFWWYAFTECHSVVGCFGCAILSFDFLCNPISRLRSPIIGSNAVFVSIILQMSISFNLFTGQISSPAFIAWTSYIRPGSIKSIASGSCLDAVRCA